MKNDDCTFLGFCIPGEESALVRLRRRIRMCYWKQWRKPRTKVRKLLALGTGKWQAIRTGLISKGYWHLARTLATQAGMTNDWLKSEGLISVRDLWMKAQGYA